MLTLLLAVAALIAFAVSALLGGSGSGGAGVAAVPPSEVPLISMRRLPEPVVTAFNVERFAKVASPRPSVSSASCVAVSVEREIVFASSADIELPAGPTMLLFTAASALQVLGPGHRFVTTVWAREAPDASGRIYGDLYIEGGGDPVLMTRSFAARLRPAQPVRTPVERLVSLISDSGVTSVAGGVVAIETRYDDEYRQPGWVTPADPMRHVGAVVALQVDDGLAQLSPPTPSTDPGALAAAVILENLRSSGLPVDGVARSSERSADPGWFKVAEIESPPLAEILAQMMRATDLSAAEMLAKEIGLRRRQEGTWQAGLAAMLDVAQDLSEGFVVPFRDASGADPANTISCRRLATAILSEGVDELVPLMPAYSEQGVLEGRLSHAEISGGFRLIGGSMDHMAGAVGRTTEGPPISVAVLITRRSGLTVSDLLFVRETLEAIDLIVNDNLASQMAVGQ